MSASSPPPGPKTGPGSRAPCPSVDRAARALEQAAERYRRFFGEPPPPAALYAQSLSILSLLEDRYGPRTVDELAEWLVEGGEACAFRPAGADEPDRTLCGLEERWRERLRERIARGWSLDRVVAEGVPERWKGWEGDVPEALFLASVYRAYGPEDGAPPPPAIRFEGGRWWDGEGFREATWTSVGGRLTREPVEAADSAIDLAGGFVLPAFGEAHTHRLGDPGHLAEDHDGLLRAGIHYAMVQDPTHAVGPRMRELSAAREAVDVAYTQGVITPSWGVMPRFYEMMAERGHFGPGVTVDSLRDRLYFEVDDAADLAEKWPAIRERNDDFVKVTLAFSEEHAERRARPDRYGAEPPRYSALPGLEPALLPEIVRRARAAGLRVSAHVETAADVRLAVEAGVDLVAHLPASWQIGAETGVPEAERERWLLSEADARAVARSGATTITTALPPLGREEEPAFAEVHRHNLETLREAGARLALGSDAFRGTVVDEVDYLDGLGVFSRVELLDLLSRATPETIFPDRRIGALAEGHEANFVVLEADPAADLSALRRIRYGVKEGIVVTVAEGPDARTGVFQLWTDRVRFRAVRGVIRGPVRDRIPARGHDSP